MRKLIIGLGTSSSKEAKEYFTEMARHRIRFRYGGDDDDSALDMAFSKKKIEDRKVWLSNWMAVRLLSFFFVWCLFFFCWRLVYKCNLCRIIEQVFIF